MIIVFCISVSFDKKKQLNLYHTDGFGSPLKLQKIAWI